ncbi:GNAT family N-acetyltransferase [Actinoplanes sp. NPDC049265]|uniref:GNAT family N-acetyltransferase n=1 Tax=Actinoplanes sp. NPDC049265 TaxID=3363902 RepID=UPI00371094D2
MTVQLRAGRNSDLAGVGDLHFRSRADAYRDILRPSTLEFGGDGRLGEWWTERWKWEQPTHRLTVATNGDELIGFTYLGPSPDDVTELYAIHVDPAHIGTGVGRLLMADALPHLAPRAVLWVLPGNVRARRFYERAGWHPDGETRAEKMGDENVDHIRYSWPTTP